MLHNRRPDGFIRPGDFIFLPKGLCPFGRKRLSLRSAPRPALLACGTGPTSTVGSAEAGSFGLRLAARKEFFAAYTPPQKTDGEWPVQMHRPFAVLG